MQLLQRACLCLIAGIVLLLFAVGATGCERQVAPPLVEVSDLTPRELELGDRLEIHGSGFPQGRIGRVVFEGHLYRPGEPPTHGVSFEAEGTVSTPDRLEIVVRDPLVERLCGRGDRAAHATFEGSLEVSFASTHPGAAPLVGILRKTTFDVLPSSARASVVEARAVEGARVLAFLGIVPGATTLRGLPIEQVLGGSPAERAGVRVGDVVAGVDGVHVLALSDIVPASARTVELAIRQSDTGKEETRSFSLVAYAGDRIPTEYLPALVIVGLAIALLVILLLPGPISLAVIEMRLAARVRTMRARDLLGALFGTGRGAAVSAILSAVVTVFALTPYVASPDVDGIVLLASAAGLLVWARVTSGRGVLALLRVIFRALPAALAMILAVGLAIGQVGALELAEIVRLQGPLPWQFTAARHPSCAILALVYGAAVIALVRDASSKGRLLQRAGLLLAAAAGASVFLGGWRLGTSFGVPGALLFLFKTWAVYAVLFGVGRVLTTLDARELPRVALRRFLPGLLLAAALVAGSRRIVSSATVETAFGATMVALVILFAVRLATRVRAAAARPEPHASPFL